MAFLGKKKIINAWTEFQIKCTNPTKVDHHKIISTHKHTDTFVIYWKKCAQTEVTIKKSGCV